MLRSRGLWALEYGLQVSRPDCWPIVSYNLLGGVEHIFLDGCYYYCCYLSVDPYLCCYRRLSYGGGGARGGGGGGDAATTIATINTRLQWQPHSQHLLPVRYRTFARGRLDGAVSQRKDAGGACPVSAVARPPVKGLRQPTRAAVDSAVLKQ